MKSVKKLLLAASAFAIFGLGVFGGVQESEARNEYSFGKQNGGLVWDGNGGEPEYINDRNWDCSISFKRACQHW